MAEQVGAGERAVPGSHALVLQRSLFVPEWAPKQESYIVNSESNICGAVMVPDIPNTYFLITKMENVSGVFTGSYCIQVCSEK